ncbi:MAG: sugar phosphate nucleotidyltransferase [Oscillospiraceae bacterium]
MKAVIMAGGNGERLRPITSTLPKPMAKLLGKPILQYILELLSANCVDEATLTLKYMPEIVCNYLRERNFGKLKINAVIEENFLGTAGSVKNAAKDFTEPFIVMSGDAMCDFDLKKACEFHKTKGADLTILCSKVSDPREYGLVNFESSGKVTSFTEKPSWAGATSNYANTGIYIINPDILSLIPDNEFFDFSKNLFPLMMSKGMSLYAYDAVGYWCDIGDADAFRNCTADLLSEKVNISLPRIANGIFLRGEMPKGNFNIIPPCYIGKNVSIKDGATIGPFSSIDDECIVGENAKIYATVLQKGAQVLANAVVNSAIICENAVLKSGVQMYESSLLGASTVVYENSIIKSNVRIWPNKIIEKGSVISENIKYGGRKNDIFSDDGIKGTLGIDLDARKCVEIGCAIASSSIGGRVGIATDEHNSSKAVAHLITGGLMAHGAHTWNFSECFLSQLYFFTSFCSLKAGLYISERNGETSIKICGEGGLSLTGNAAREIEMRIERSDFNNCDNALMRPVSDMSSVGVMYEREALGQAITKLSGMSANIKCSNEKINMLLEDCLYRAGCKIGDEITFKINNDATSVSAFYRECGWISGDKLLAICCNYELKNGKDVAIPYDAPHAINIVASEYERRVLRYLKSPVDSCDSEARSLAAKQIFARDAVFMTMKILGIIKETGNNLSQLLEELPKFYVLRKNYSLSFLPSEICEALNFDCTVEQTPEGIAVRTSSGRILLTPSKTGKMLRIMAEANTMEASNALCEDIEERLNKH